MPRAWLSSQDVGAAAAEPADEAGYKELTVGLVAQRLGIRTFIVNGIGSRWRVTSTTGLCAMS